MPDPSPRFPRFRSETPIAPEHVAGLVAILAGAGLVGWGVHRLVARPDLPLDYGLLFLLGAPLVWRGRAIWQSAPSTGIPWRQPQLEEGPTDDAMPSGPAPDVGTARDADGAPDTAEAPGRAGAPAVAAPPRAGSSRGAWDWEGPAGAPPRPGRRARAQAPDMAVAATAPPPRRAAQVAGMLLVGLALALVAQVWLDARHELATGTILGFLAAVALWLAALARWPEPVADAPVPAASGPRLDAVRWAALGVGQLLVLFPVLIAPLAGRTVGDLLGVLRYPDGAVNSLTVLGGGMWFVGTVLCFWALVDWSGPAAWWRSVWDGEALWVRVSGVSLAVIAITGLGAWYRFHDLARLPYEMTSDHTEKLVDIGTIVDGLRPVFMPGNAGREPMEFYWIALLVGLGLPLSFLTMKIGMSIVSTLTIPVVYRLGREVAGTEAGLMAALILAMAPWHIQITRIALRIAFAPLWVALTLIFLYRALASGRRNDWLATGLCLGLGMYGYTAFRPMIVAVPLIIALKLAHDLARRWRAGRAAASEIAGMSGVAGTSNTAGTSEVAGTRDRGGTSGAAETSTAGPRGILPPVLVGHLAAAAGLAMVVVAPLARYAYDQREAFFARTLTRVTQAETAFENPPVTQFFVNLKNALLMVNLTGDSAWFQSPAARPAFETVGGALFVLGLAVVLHRVVWRRDWRTGALAAIVPIMLLSTIMALAFPRENPSLSRASAALPMIAVIAALPLPALAARLRAWGLAGSAVYAAVLVALFVWMGRGTTARYFGEYRAQYDNSTHNTSEGADVIRAFVTQGGDIAHAYYVGWSNGWDFRALGYLLGAPEWNGLVGGTDMAEWSDAAEGARPHVSDPRRKLYLVGGPYADKQLETLRSLYPNAVVTRQASRVPGKEFWSVFVPDAPPPTPTSAATATPGAAGTPGPDEAPPGIGAPGPGGAPQAADAPVPGVTPTTTELQR